jgi:signal transduction histidine kinase
LVLLTEGESSLITIDKDRIGGVISNLISNAVKYTPRGGKIRVHVQDLEDSSVLTVEDNGVGIPQDEQLFIFERFYRADKSRNRNTGSAGIGLAIVKSVVAAHGGSVDVQSDLNCGTAFTVKLPKIQTSNA